MTSTKSGLRRPISVLLLHDDNPYCCCVGSPLVHLGSEADLDENTGLLYALHCRVWRASVNNHDCAVD